MQLKPLQPEDKSEKVSTQFFTRYASKRYINNYQIHFWAINAVLMRFKEKNSINLILKLGCPNLHALKSLSSILRWPPLLLRSTPMLYYYLNSKFFQSWTFLIKIYNILKKNILTCSCWASVESWLLWRYASRSSLLYSDFRYTIELPLQPCKIQLYTFRVQG